MAEEEKKQYTGRGGYHGGGRKKKAPEDKAPKKYKNFTVSALPEDIEKIKELAKNNNKTVSKFIVDSILNK